MRPQRHRRLNLALAVVAVAMLVALSVVLLLDDDEDPAAGTGQSQCGQPALTSSDGTPLDPDRARSVAGVHAAACAGDYNALVAFIPEWRRSYGSTLTPSGIVEGWRREDPSGVKLRAVAKVLERPGVGGQGGLEFCEPDKGRIGFSRGTIDAPPGLGSIEFPQEGRPVECSPHTPGSG
ncbi:hypothetical protein SUDANB95_03005 [Actinosynnema sp. ALI-1.44]